jgi:tetratricopeptide (TPR) repeat protein
MSNFKDLANNSFFKRDYKRALLNYSLALKEKPDDTEAKIGALLADMAFEKEDEAVALFEYYEVTKAIDAKNAHETIERIIQNVDERNDPLYDILSTIEERISVIEDGILYEEFIAHVSSRENIKLALEDLIFSTKIIIYKKEDFVELIGMLLDNGYDEMAYNYIESALTLYPDDRLFYDFLQTLEQN